MNDAEIELDDDDVNDELLNQDYEDYYEHVAEQKIKDMATILGEADE